MIPITETPNPLYKPRTPLGPLAVLLRQSHNPEKSRLPDPTSEANRVLFEARTYGEREDVHLGIRGHIFWSRGQ